MPQAHGDVAGRSAATRSQAAMAMSKPDALAEAPRLMARPSRARKSAARSAPARPSWGLSMRTAKGTVAVARSARRRGPTSEVVRKRMAELRDWKRVGTKRSSVTPSRACHAPARWTSSAPPTGASRTWAIRSPRKRVMTAVHAMVSTETENAGRTLMDSRRGSSAERLTGHLRGRLPAGGKPGRCRARTRGRAPGRSRA